MSYLNIRVDTKTSSITVLWLDLSCWLECFGKLEVPTCSDVYLQLFYLLNESFLLLVCTGVVFYHFWLIFHLRSVLLAIRIAMSDGFLASILFVGWCSFFGSESVGVCSGVGVVFCGDKESWIQSVFCSSPLFCVSLLVSWGHLHLTLLRNIHSFLWLFCLVGLLFVLFFLPCSY